MKRVLQITAQLGRGGLEAFVMNVYREINKEELQFDFLTTQPDGDYAEEITAMGGRIYQMPVRNKGVFAYNKALDDFFKQHHDYIAIHEHISSLTSIAPAYYAKKYNISVRIFHAHSSSVQKSLKFHWLHILLHYLNKPKVHSWATHYLGCSDKALDWMYKYTGIRGRALMINNGIDSLKYAFNNEIRKKIRSELGIYKDDFVIGHVGSFIPLKNQSFLIDILNELLKKNSKTKLLLIGDGQTRKEVMLKSQALGLDKFCIFTGIRTDVHKLMLAMDAFVMPSWFEGLPVSLVEAQASGLPIIASDTISYDSDITGTILFKSINDIPQKWADYILQWVREKGRTDNIHLIKKAGFDSTETSKKILNIYYGRIV